MPPIISSIIDCYVFRRAATTVEFLALRRASQSRLGGTWQAVHGKIETGEKAWETALRELREETGLRPIAFWQLEAVNTFYVAQQDQILMCPGFAAEVDANAKVTLCDEHVDYAWWPADEAHTKFMWPGQRTAIAEIVEVILPRGPAEAHLRIAI
ncbi:MAG: NUDIX pyrophosphatase [Phycisphaerae bacterium]